MKRTLAVCLCVFLCGCLCVFLCACLRVCLCLSLGMSVFVCLSLCVPASVYRLKASSFLHPSVCSSASVCVSVCPVNFFTFVPKDFVISSILSLFYSVRICRH